MRIKITLLFLVLFIGTSYGEDVESMLHTLDLKLEQRDSFQVKKEEKINFLKKFLAENTEKNDLFSYGIYKLTFI